MILISKNGRFQQQQTKKRQPPFVPFWNRARLPRSFTLSFLILWQLPWGVVFGFLLQSMIFVLHPYADPCVFGNVFYAFHEEFLPVFCLGSSTNHSSSFDSPPFLLTFAPPNLRSREGVLCIPRRGNIFEHIYLYISILNLAQKFTDTEDVKRILHVYLKFVFSFLSDSKIEFFFFGFDRFCGRGRIFENQHLALHDLSIGFLGCDFIEIINIAFFSRNKISKLL